MRTHWVALFVKTNEAIDFHSFGIEHIPKEINKFINNDITKPSSLKRIKSNIFRIQAHNSILCGYFCMEFINYMLKGKTLLDYTNLFSLNDFNELTNVTKYRLDELNKIRDYFNNEIKERKDIIKKLNKYIVSLII